MCLRFDFLFFRGVELLGEKKRRSTLQQLQFQEEEEALQPSREDQPILQVITVFIVIF